MTDIYESKRIWDARVREQYKKKRRWTQQDLADEINQAFPHAENVTQNMISRWVNISKGDRPFPPYERMRMIAHVLEVDVAYLTGDIDGTTHDEQDAADHMGIGVEGVRGIRDAVRGKNSSLTGIRGKALTRLFSCKPFIETVVPALEDYFTIPRLAQARQYKSCHVASIIRETISKLAAPYRQEVIGGLNGCFSELQHCVIPSTYEYLDEQGRELVRQQVDASDDPDRRKALDEMERQYLARDMHQLSEFPPLENYLYPIFREEKLAEGMSEEEIEKELENELADARQTGEFSASTLEEWMLEDRPDYEAILKDAPRSLSSHPATNRKAITTEQTSVTRESSDGKTSYQKDFPE